MAVGNGTPTIEKLLRLPAWVAFDVDAEGRVLAGSDESGSVQLVEIAPDGTAEPLTALPGRCSGRYLPGERAVVVQHDEGGNERTQLSLLRLDGSPGELEPLVHDPRYVHGLLDVAPGRITYRTNRRNGVDFDIVSRDPATGAEQVVHGAGGTMGEFALAPDGLRAVAIAASHRLAMTDELYLLQDGAEARLVTDPDQPAQYHSPAWLGPDGRALLVTTCRGREFTALARYEPDADAWSWLVTDDARDLTGVPSPDGRLLLVMADDGGRARLTLHHAGSGELLHRLALPGDAHQDGWAAFSPLPRPVWSADSRYVVVSYADAARPGDVLRVDAVDGSVTVVASGPAVEQPARPVAHRVPTPDGEEIPCFVYRSPAPADPSLAASAVLVIHGGPEGEAVRGFNVLVQAFAAAGHTVVVPNVRGSRGYGKRWYSLDDKRLRLDSIADLAALHAWLPSIGVDPGRAALYGGSYGGYMVLAGLAFQPGLWAAGVDVVGMSSLLTLLQNTSAYRRAVREREYGSLEHDREFLIEASPLSRVDAISAPLFVIHGRNDPRVPLSEAGQLVTAVRARGVPCDLLVYPDEGHGLSKRANRLDAYPQVLAFLARHLAVPVREFDAGSPTA